MKLLLTIALLCIATIAGANSFFLVTPQSRSVSAAASTPFVWTNYSTIVYEFSDNTEPSEDRSFIGTNVANFLGGGTDPAWIAATGTMSAHYDFDGGDYLVDHRGKFSGDTSLFMSAWVRVDSHVDYAGILVSVNGNSENIALSANTAANPVFRMDVTANFGDTINVNGGNRVIGEWTHVAAWWTKGENKGFMTQDGMLVGTSAYEIGTEVIFAADDFKVGFDDWNPARKFNGAIDDIYLGQDGGTNNFRYVLTNAVWLFRKGMTNHGWCVYDYENPNQHSNTIYVGNWEYDAFADKSAARTNYATKQAGAASPTHVIEGLTNGYYSFDGGDWAEIAGSGSTSSDFNLQKRGTVMAWVWRPDSPAWALGGDFHLVGRGNDGSTRSWYIWYDNTGGNGWKLTGPKNDNSSFETAKAQDWVASLQAEEWTFVAFQWQSESGGIMSNAYWKASTNGAVVPFYTNFATITNNFIPNNEPLRISADWNGTNHWRGYIDGTRISTNWVPEAEISNVWNTTKGKYGY